MSAGSSYLLSSTCAVSDGDGDAIGAEMPGGDDVQESNARLEAVFASRTAELIRSEAMHRQVIEFLPGGVYHIASDGSFLNANIEGLRFMGITWEMLRAQAIPDFSGTTFHEDGSPCKVEEYPASRCLATGQPQGPLTIGLRRPDGLMSWAVFTAAPLPCPIHPGKTGTVVTFLDITERKRVEDKLRASEEALRQAGEELEQRVIERTSELACMNQQLREQNTQRTLADRKLRESEERFREMAENVSEVVWIVEADTSKVLYISPAYETVWGRSCQSMYEDGRSFLEGVLPEDRPIAERCLERQRVEPFDAVYRVLGARGAVRWVRNRSTPIRDADGRIHRVTGITEDITDLKHVESELSRLASIVESSDDAIIGKSLEGTIVSWNSGAERIYGYAANEVLGAPCSVLLRPEDHGMVGPLLARVARGERIATFETIRMRKDGRSFPVSSTVSAVRESAGKIIGAAEIDRDITDRKRLEQEVLQISERERRRIGQDLHDGLGQLLTGISFLGKSLQQRLAGKAAAAAPATAEESDEAAQIADLVQQAVVQTRALARGLHPVEPTPGGLEAALAELAARAAVFSKVQCDFACPAPVHVYDNVVATHLYRIAQEAVNNSAKHAKTKRVMITLQMDPEHLCLTIEDDGIGMGHRAAGETGLGVRIMRYRAKMIDGVLTLGGGSARGTVVSCTVPRRRAEGASDAQENVSS